MKNHRQKQDYEVIEPSKKKFVGKETIEGYAEKT